jgi:hypothetical protein
MLADADFGLVSILTPGTGCGSARSCSPDAAGSLAADLACTAWSGIAGS